MKKKISFRSNKGAAMEMAIVTILTVTLFATLALIMCNSARRASLRQSNLIYSKLLANDAFEDYVSSLQNGTAFDASVYEDCDIVTDTDTGGTVFYVFSSQRMLLRAELAADNSVKKREYFPNDSINTVGLNSVYAAQQKTLESFIRSYRNDYSIYYWIVETDGTGSPLTHIVIEEYEKLDASAETTEAAGGEQDAGDTVTQDRKITRTLTIEAAVTDGEAHIRLWRLRETGD